MRSFEFLVGFTLGYLRFLKLMKGSNENMGLNYYELGPNEKVQLGVMDQKLPGESKASGSPSGLQCHPSFVLCPVRVVTGVVISFIVIYY